MSALETDHNEKEYQTSVQSVCVFNETQIKIIDLIVIRLVLNYPFILMVDDPQTRGNHTLWHILFK